MLESRSQIATEKQQTSDFRVCASAAAGAKRKPEQPPRKRSQFEKDNATCMLVVFRRQFDFLPVTKANLRFNLLEIDFNK